MPNVTVHDFRVLDRVLAETEPDAGDVVFLSTSGGSAYPFVVSRKISGPGGVYIDALDVIDADGATLGTWERQFELDGESKPRTITTELREVRFGAPGTYTLQYSIYDDVIGHFAFTVVDQPAPGEGIVFGPLDASLSKSTIAWLSFGDEIVPDPEGTGQPVDVPRYIAGKEWPVWYGYENGRVFVLIGEKEQQIPGLLESQSVRLIARSKDKRSKVADVECGTEKLPKDAEWDRIATDLLLGRRLNLRDGEAAVKRWKDTCEIVALTPLAPPAPEERMEVVTS